MGKSYIDLVAKQKFYEASESPNEVSTDIKKQLITFGASIDTSENIYEAFRNFIEENVKKLETKTELLDTIAFCEADEADLESTLIKLKIAADNSVLSEALADVLSYDDNNAEYLRSKRNFIDRELSDKLSNRDFSKITSVDAALKGPFSYIMKMFKDKMSLQKIESSILSLQNSFYNNTHTFSSEVISIVEETFDYLWDKFDKYSATQLAYQKEGNIKMIDKDFLITESDINRSVKENSYNPRAELDPIRCFVILDKNDMPMLNKGGIVITNTPDAEDQIQTRADDLYRLIHNAKSIYIIEDEAYDKCVDIRDKKEYVKFVKANGTLIKPSKDLFTFESSDIEDPDFLLDIEEMFE